MLNLIEQFIQKFGGLTEEYKFYKDEVVLRYDPKAHIYLLVQPDGTLKEVEGVTSVVHIIDKSDALVPWGCKMMAQKLLSTSELFKVEEPWVTLHSEGTDTYYKLEPEQLEKWINEGKSAHKDQLEEAGNIGKLAHAWIESYIKAVLADNEGRKLELLAKLPTEEKAANCCMAALEWMQRHNVRWISTERKVYSREHQFAGTMDGLCVVDSCDDPECCPHQFKDRLSIADWKTSNYLYIDYILQTAAYQEAYEEETGDEVIDRWIIRLGKEDAEFDPWHLEGRELYIKNWVAFHSALELSRQVEETKNLINKVLDHRKALEAERKKAEREAALKVKCKGADKYKGVRYPKCNGGHPCETCLTKWREKHVL